MGAYACIHFSMYVCIHFSIFGCIHFLVEQIMDVYIFRFLSVHILYVWPETMVNIERFKHPYIQTYQKPKQFTIQTFPHKTDPQTMYVKPYLLDKTHGNNTYNKIHT